MPTVVLKYTSPQGPHPFILDLPSRDYATTKRTIPVYVFLPPLSDHDPYGDLSTANNAESIREKKTTNDLRVRYLPVIVDFHGGGFYMGSPLEQAPFCAQMARNLSCIVISVDYRMGPIDKFPAAVHDAEDVLDLILNPPEAGKENYNSESYTGSWKSSSLPNSRPVSRQSSRPSSRHSSRPSTPRPQSNSAELEKTISYRINETLYKARRSDPTASLPQPTRFCLDRHRVAVCGFSSGGNVALNMGLDVPSASPHISAHEKPWLCPFSSAFTSSDTDSTKSDATHLTLNSQPRDNRHQIPLLLFYPSLDLRQLPSERVRPEKLGAGSPFWSRLNDTLAPSYCPRDLTNHLRASPGLASPAKDIHRDAKMFLVLCGLDTLADQSDIWVKKCREEGRGSDLYVEKYESMKHGWTQFPESFLKPEEKKTRVQVFNKTETFLKASWAGRDPVMAVGQMGT